MSSDYTAMSLNKKAEGLYTPHVLQQWLCTNLQKVVCVQDMIHIGVKLKARLLKPSIVLPMGFYLACSAHLQIITNIYGKDTHKLRNSYIIMTDRILVQQKI